MWVKKDIELKDFDFWGGAKSRAERLTTEEFEIIQDYFDEIADNGEIFTETQINDIFWFEIEFVLDCLGISEEDFYAR